MNRSRAETRTVFFSTRAEHLILADKNFVIRTINNAAYEPQEKGYLEEYRWAITYSYYYSEDWRNALDAKHTWRKK